MKLHSDSFEHGQPIPPEFAMGARDGDNGFGGNRNPHLAWRDVPDGTRSFALLCIDTDAPTDGALVADDSVDIPVAHPRGDFVHWTVVDIPAAAREIVAGGCSDGIAPKGKPAGIDAGGTVITNVAAGQLSATSTDAVNGSQLFAVAKGIKGVVRVDASALKVK